MNTLIRKMKYLVILTSLVCFSFSTNEVISPNLSGSWNLVIDNQIDGVIQGNNGCTKMTFHTIDGTTFQAEYTKCLGSKNAMGSIFNGEYFEAKRGILVTFNQYNETTDYYATWSGRYYNNTIQGIWTDIKGNQGEFKLTR